MDCCREYKTVCDARLWPRTRCHSFGFISLVSPFARHTIAVRDPVRQKGVGVEMDGVSWPDRVVPATGLHGAIGNAMPCDKDDATAL